MEGFKNDNISSEVNIKQNILDKSNGTCDKALKDPIFTSTQWGVLLGVLINGHLTIYTFLQIDACENIIPEQF